VYVEIPFHLTKPEGLQSPWSLVQIQPLSAFISEAHNPRSSTGPEAGATVLYGDSLDGAAANGAGFASHYEQPRNQSGLCYSALVLSSPEPAARLEFPIVQPFSLGSIPS
jgi:hypothetical protein